MTRTEPDVRPGTASRRMESIPDLGASAVEAPSPKG
jgi:hypothetical protein